MNVAELRAELESDRAWREEELLAFQNRGSRIDDEAEHDRYRRALVVLLYAHYEGFCKFALSSYISVINSSGAFCRDADYSITAASLSDTFHALINPEKKSPFFRNALPDDAKLHRFARMCEFVERTSELEKSPVQIADDVVDVESNLSPIVLQKNLFRLGLPYEAVEVYKGEIHRLLNFRNKIAHGEARAGVDAHTYDGLRKAASEVMTQITIAITTAARERAYLRRATTPAIKGTLESHAEPAAEA